MSSQAAPFRFRDLPKEIRVKIYRELLCDFKPKLTTLQPLQMFESCVSTPRNIDTAILHTSTAMYREVYNVMVKTNRFVKVTTARGLPTYLMLNGQQVPVVAANKKIVNSFGGYVLAVHLGTSKPAYNTPEFEHKKIVVPRTMMMLHQDMDSFCAALMDGDAFSPGFTAAVEITIKVGPTLTGSQPERYAPSFADFFSDTTQKASLAPFRTILRGFKSVNIQGHVDEDIAISVREDIHQDRWSDPTQVLADLAATKEEGSRLFKQGNMEDASLAWKDAALDIDKMVESSSWPELTQYGGERFLVELSELYFLVRLNSAHLQLNSMQASVGRPAYYAGLMADDDLESAIKSMKKDYWMQEYKYRPSLQLQTKLWYRYALLLRLQKKPGTADRAFTYINGALQNQPDDAAIMRERVNIMAWMQRG